MVTTIEAVPTFFPSLEEFSEPFSYFTQLRDAGRQYGIVRIVTPEGWRPKQIPKVVEPFDSYRQDIHALQTGREFGTGDDYTASSYEQYAKELSEKWMTKHPESTDAMLDDPASEMQMSEAIERAYWSVQTSTTHIWKFLRDIVEGRTKDKVEVDYASNHHVVEKRSTSSHWTLSSLIEEEDNVLRYVGSDIPGITQPWLYHGCLFSTFCWHVEDHFMYSVNYHHQGAPKIWYGIPSSCAEDFENYITSSVSTRSMKADVLNRLTKMISPYDLPDTVCVYKAIQQPGDMILTFPRAFHGGYNEGWNCAEAVNFATMDWVMFGQIAAKRYRSPECTKQSLFCHDRLLWILTDKETDESPKDGIPRELRQAMKDAGHNERERRREVRSKLFNVKEVVPKKRWNIDRPVTCSVCDEHVFFSYVSCECRVDEAEVLCLQDALKPGMFSCGCTPYLCTEVTNKELTVQLMVTESGSDNEDESTE